MRNTQKPTGMSRDEFVRNLSKTGLIAADELRKTLNALPSSASEDDVLTLAHQLTAAGKLTTFQLEAILDGKPQDLVLGNYDVLQRLGAGGMGTVFKARHRRMKRIVAIKVLAGAVAKDPKFLLRFQREVETVARLNHPNIVMAYDADEAEAGPFLVMEFVNGRDLATRVQERGPLPLGDAVDCTLQAARGLSYAHSQGIVHRDVKPANLLQDVSGVVKVADLGLARLNDAASQSVEGAGSITQAGSVVGTVDYMPPEQAEDSTTIDHRADIYSLGCTLYFLLTGKPPYVGQTLMATLLKHRQAPVPSLIAARPDVPPALDALFQRMAAKLPAERWGTMEEVVRGLEALPPLPVSTVNWDGAASSPGATVESQTAAFDSPDLLAAALGDTTTIGPGIRQDEQPSTEIPVLGAMKLLLVEPSRTQAVIVRNFLQGVGIPTVATVATGQKALESMRAARPHAVISTMHLNDMTGVQLLEQMRADQALARIGFVLIASEADASDTGAVHGLAAVLLPKPFTQEQMARALRQATS
jgi:serine/threonine protein kinase